MGCLPLLGASRWTFVLHGSAKKGVRIRTGSWLQTICYAEYSPERMGLILQNPSLPLLFPLSTQKISQPMHGSQMIYTAWITNNILIAQRHTYIHISTHLLTTYFPWPRTMSWKVFSFFRQLTWWGESGLEDLVTLLMAYGQLTKAVVESVGHPRWVDAISWACISGVESKAQPERAEPDSAMAWWK